MPADSALPPTAPKTPASLETRTALARDWPTAAMVDRQMGLVPEAKVQPSLVATRLRQGGKILGVCMTHTHPHHYRYPSWQFDGNGQPIALMGDILDLLRSRGPCAGNEEGEQGWCEVTWFMTPHALLEGRAPVEVLEESPERVLEAARREFDPGRDTPG